MAAIDIDTAVAGPLSPELARRMNAYWRGEDQQSHTVLARVGDEELGQFRQGCGWEPLLAEGDDPAEMHQLMDGTLDKAIEDIRRIQGDARATGDTTRRRWPMIVLKSPKGWTGPKASTATTRRRPEVTAPARPPAGGGKILVKAGAPPGRQDARSCRAGEARAAMTGTPSRPGSGRT